MKTSHRRRRRSAGFTMIELLIATSVSGLLAGVAYPSFSSALQKMRRTDALVAMVQLQHAEERWRSGSSRYGSLAEVGVAERSPAGHYRLSVADPQPHGFVAVAEASGAQAGDRACRFLRVEIDAGNVVYRSGETAAADNPSKVNRQCWNL